MPMETKEVKAKLQEMVDLADELIPELGNETNPGVLLQQCQTQLVQVRRTVNLLLDTVKEAEDTSKDEKVKENLPKKAPSPASKADKSGS